MTKGSNDPSKSITRGCWHQGQQVSTLPPKHALQRKSEVRRTCCTAVFLSFFVFLFCFVASLVFSGSIKKENTALRQSPRTPNIQIALSSHHSLKRREDNDQRHRKIKNERREEGKTKNNRVESTEKLPQNRNHVETETLQTLDGANDLLRLLGACSN